MGLKQVDEVPRLYQEQYFDFNVRHFHEKLVTEPEIKLSYTVGETGVAGIWPGEERSEARSSSEAATAARDAVAH